MDEMMLILFVSLSMTILLELVFFLLVGMRQGRNILLVVMVNVITNPSVVLLYYFAASYVYNNLIPVVLCLETVAIAVEGSYYRHYGKDIHHPFVLSFCANLFSYGTGMLINFFSF